jgi:hypothetical protein
VTRVRADQPGTIAFGHASIVPDRGVKRELGVRVSRVSRP